MPTDEPQKSSKPTDPFDSKLAWIESELTPEKNFRDLLRAVLTNEFGRSNGALAFVIASALISAGAALSVRPQASVEISRGLIEFAGSWASQLLGLLLAAFTIFSTVAASNLAIHVTINRSPGGRSLSKQMALSFIGAAMPMLAAYAVQFASKALWPKGGHLSATLWGASQDAARVGAALTSLTMGALLGWMFLALRDVVVNVYRTFLMMLYMHFQLFQDDWTKEIREQLKYEAIIDARRKAQSQGTDSPLPR